MPRVVAITGVCTDTAVSTATEFARRGAALALISREPDPVASATLAVRDLGAEALGLVVDVVDPDAVESAADRIEAALGPVDVWVNIADPDPGAPFEDLSPEDFRSVTERCYLGYVHTTMTALERMKVAGGGTIVQVSTTSAREGRPGFAAASGAEAALRGFHEALAAELHQESSPVRVVLVQPPEEGGVRAVAHRIVRASRRPDRSSALKRGAAIGGGAAVAAGTAAFLRRRR